MKMYVSVFRIRLINNLQYRAVVFGEIITRLAWGLMEILAYSVLYRTGNAAFPMKFSQTVSYVWSEPADNSSICNILRLSL